MSRQVIIGRRLDFEDERRLKASVSVVRRWAKENAEKTD